MGKELVGRLEDTIVAELVALGQHPEKARDEVRLGLRTDIVVTVRDAIRLAGRGPGVVPPPPSGKKK